MVLWEKYSLKYVMPALDSRQGQGLLFVFSSPSGAGKTLITQTLVQQDSNLHLSISMTTRAPRAQEHHGKDYFFTSQVDFQARIQRHEFAEHALVFGNFYGTLIQEISIYQAQGKDIVFDIDWQGAQQLKERYGTQVVTIFILPPSLQELEQRLRKRSQDTEEVIAYRMAKAARELSHWSEYDYIIMNENLPQALTDSQSIIAAERLRHRGQPHLKIFIQNMMPSSEESER